MTEFKVSITITAEDRERLVYLNLDQPLEWEDREWLNKFRLNLIGAITAQQPRKED